MKEKTIIRQNMMDDKNYRPYCGAERCSGGWPRMIQMDNLQFRCPSCGFNTQIDKDFIDRYRDRWSIGVTQ